VSEPLPRTPLWRRWLADARSLEDVLSGPSAAEPAELVAVLRVVQRRDWQHGRRVPAEEYLNRAPGLRTDLVYALDLVYAEFLLREELGEAPDPDEYVRRFPDLAEQLGRQLSVHRAVCAIPGSLDSDADARPTVPERAGAAGLPQLAGYELQRELGRGGMGVVYEAADAVMGRRVAVKLIHPELLRHPVAVARFCREVRAAARLAHPNLVTAFDAGQSAGHHFLAMELVEGENLAELLQRSGPLPVARACALVRQAALGLQHAHERGLVHRDVKPHNLLLASDGTVKVLDFGLAALTGDGAATGGATSAGAVMGTPDYMAPEQADDPRAAGPAADVYALGCTLFHLLTGQAPFPKGTAMQTLLAHQEEAAPSVRRLRPEVLPALDAVLRRALAKRPRRRFRSAAALAEALRPFADPNRTGASVPEARRRRYRLLAAVSLPLVMAALLAAAFLRPRPANEPALAVEPPPPPAPADDPAPARASGAPFREIHGADEAAFLKWVNALSKDGFRPVSLSERAGGDEPRFNGIAVRDGRDFPTATRLGMSGAEAHDHFFHMTDLGYRIIASCLYRDGGRQKHGHVWVKDGVGFSGYGDRLGNLEALLGERGHTQGMIPIYLSAEPATGGPEGVRAVFAPAAGRLWWAGHDVTRRGLRDMTHDYPLFKWRISHVNAYQEDDRVLFLVVACDNPDKLAWDCRLDLSGADYEQALRENEGRGLRPAAVASYRDGDEVRYAAVWEPWQSAEQPREKP
jgi:tRNA A-37 threonylcarbamoyl transferase component Bud32